jgi:hypothetical protein
LATAALGLGAVPQAWLDQRDKFGQYPAGLCPTSLL